MIVFQIISLGLTKRTTCLIAGTGTAISVMQIMLLAVILKAGTTIYFSISSMQNCVQMHLQMLVGRLRPFWWRRAKLLSRKQFFQFVMTQFQLLGILPRVQKLWCWRNGRLAGLWITALTIRWHLNRKQMPTWHSLGWWFPFVDMTAGATDWNVSSLIRAKEVSA